MSYKRKEIIGDCELYLGDCLEVMPTLDKVDAVVTDPPYGIDFVYESYNDTSENWYALINSIMPILFQKSKFIVMPVCSIDRLKWWYEKHSPEWIIAWHKGSPGQRSRIGFSDWEPHLTWGFPYKPMHDFFSTPCGFEQNGHPCPKPISYANWLIKRAADSGQTIFDPFMGSGTTGVACVKQGRKFIGIELEERYFNIACKRIDEAYRQPDLFIDKPKNKVFQEDLI